MHREMNLLSEVCNMSNLNRRMDQASELRRLFNKAQQTTNIEGQKNNQQVTEKRNIHVLNLPSRKEAHQQKQKMNYKIGIPFIRLLLFMIIIGIIIAVSFIY